MITEIAQIDVKPGTEKDFEAAVAKARPLFLRARGGKGFELHKSIEKPSRYRLMAKWDTLENWRRKTAGLVRQPQPQPELARLA